MKLPKEAKWVIWGLAAVVVLVVVYFVYRSLTKIKDVKENNELIDKANAEIDESKITLTKVQLSTLVEKLHKAMDGLGTDTAAVYDAFRTVSTRSDVLALIATFGVIDGETLSEWLYDDLSQSEINKVNSILASKNIDYKF